MSSSTSGSVGIHGLRVECVIGIHTHEQQRRQPLFIDAELDVDLGAALGSGRIEDAVDYEQVAQLLSALAQKGEHRLLEGYAAAAAAALLERFAGATAVRLEVRKPLALDAARDCYVRLERRR